MAAGQPILLLHTRGARSGQPRSTPLLYTRRIAVHPHEAEGAEREELWRVVNDNYNGYQVYQQRAGGRTIPVVLLEPA